MLKVYLPGPTGAQLVPCAEGDRLPARPLWIDLLEPVAHESRTVEKLLGIEIPTREEQQEIEMSSRLYEENGSLFMTAMMVFKADTPHPESTAITFILAGDTLVTLRYADPQPFRVVAGRAERTPALCRGGRAVLFALLDAIIDRTADILERVGADIDGISRAIFDASTDSRPKIDLRATLRRIGRNGDIATQSRESLLTVDRLLLFLAQAPVENEKKELRSRAKNIDRDVRSLSDQAAFLSNKVNFLLDATLGLINIEQNAIIKIFSIAAVVFLPPTLIASVYGMNFELMPELKWAFGYPFALALMVISAIIPLAIFKRRGWL
ncbi:MAG: magnesium/cobalt transporter CorA [Rhodospirillaceae bacterium]